MLAKHCLEEFKLDCQLRRLTDRTIKGYYNNTLNFLIYAEKHHGITEFKKQVALSKVQTTPYRCVLAWFKQQFEGYDDYKSYFAELATKEARKKDIFAVVKSSAVIEVEDTDEEEYEFLAAM